METSPQSCLPEVESLPDGFFEGSSDPVDRKSPLDYKDALIDIGMSAEIERIVMNPDITVVDGFGSSKGFVGEAKESEKEGSKSFEGEETKGCLEFTTPQVAASATNSECKKTKKIDPSETKRKVKKSNIRPKNEFLELALMYQKVTSERDAAVAAREKLESLCRELQRQNKLLMEECQRVSTEGQNIRSDLSTKFKDAIKDVSIKLEEQKDDCISQLKENEMLKNKLKHLGDQYILAEQQFEQKLKQKTLEVQIADLKLQQHQENITAEQTQMQLYSEQVIQLQETEKKLRLQLNADDEKFQQFQDALLKSNQVFETFKQEMEKMTKLIKDLKKENAFLKGKCEKTDFTLIKLVEDRESTKKQIEKLTNQKEKLESLCRSLQAERKQFSNKESD